jgi:hypothetical protein
LFCFFFFWFSQSTFAEIIGGGFSVGTLVVLEEDVYSTFNQYLLRYFVAEGICCSQRLYIASAEGDATTMLKSLPHVSTSQAHLAPSSSSAPEDKVRKYFRSKSRLTLTIHFFLNQGYENCVAI